MYILHFVWIKSKQSRKTPCIVDLDMFKRDLACLNLTRVLFSNTDRTYSMSVSLISGIPLPLCVCVSNFYSQKIMQINMKM